MAQPSVPARARARVRTRLRTPLAGPGPGPGRTGEADVVAQGGCPGGVPGVSRGCPGGVPETPLARPPPARPGEAGAHTYTHHAHHNTRTGTGMGPSARALHVLGPAADTARSKSRGVRHIGLPFCFFSYVLAFHFDPAQPSQISSGRSWRSMHDARSTRRPSHRMAFSNFTFGRKERSVCIVSQAILAFS